ncbi:Hypothetical protein CINCED_3A022475 [Cinara cedri]|nr:Hypothetical protein CINCED_3A022475 [Cinara cedri]
MFVLTMVILFIVIAILFIISKNYVVEKQKHDISPDFQKLQRSYLIVYCMACFADWLQGPYVYSLYKHYGYNEGEIAVLFIVGTISNSLFGTFTGALADNYGRKILCILYGLLYSGCCITKLYENYRLLLLGRLLGGISTSILYSAFDSWYINEHVNYYKLPNEWLNNTFAKATFLNAMLAIFAGILSYFLVNILEFGPVSPFIMAIPFLMATSIYSIMSLNEHYIYNAISPSSSVKNAIVLWLTNKNIFTLSIVQSFYEGVMYLFIFIWTPALEPIKPPLGLIFSSFMLALMIGSKIYSIMSANNVLDSTKLLEISTFLASFSFLICSVVSTVTFTNYSPYTIQICYLFFIFYEISIGIYLPSMTYLKSHVIPEKVRVTISNVIKIPSNMFICLALLWIHLKEKSHKTDGDIIFTIYNVCLIATTFTFMCSKIFSKFHHKTYKDGIKHSDVEV